MVLLLRFGLTRRSCWDDLAQEAFRAGEQGDFDCFVRLKRMPFSLPTIRLLLFIALKHCLLTMLAIALEPVQQLSLGAYASVFPSPFIGLYL